MKKILFVGHSPNFSGAEYSLFRLLQHAKSQIDARVLAPGGGSFEEHVRSEQIPFYEFKAAPLMRYKLGPDNRLLDCLEMVSQNLKKLPTQIDPPDLVHSNTAHVIEGALLASHWGVPHVWNFREVLVDSPTWEPYLGLDHFYQTLNLLSDHFICNSQALMDSLPESCREKSSVIHNGLNPKGLASREEARAFYEREFSIPKDAKVALTVGNFILEKGHGDILPHLAEVSKKIPELIFLWPGEHHYTYLDIRRQVDELGLSNKIIMPGQVPAFGRWMKGADLYLLTSRTEAFPTVVLEARLAGVPVIARDCGGVREILQKGGGVLSPFDDLPDFSKRIAELIEGSLEIEQVEQNDFSEEEMAQKYINTYNQIPSDISNQLEERRQVMLDFEHMAKSIDQPLRLVNLARRLESSGLGRLVKRLLGL